MPSGARVTVPAVCSRFDTEWAVLASFDPCRLFGIKKSEKPHLARYMAFGVRRWLRWEVGIVVFRGPHPQVGQATVTAAPIGALQYELRRQVFVVRDSATRLRAFPRPRPGDQEHGRGRTKESYRTTIKEKREREKMKRRFHTNASPMILAAAAMLHAQPLFAQNAPPAADQATTGTASETPSSQAQPEIIVTGTRLNNGLNAPSPVAVVSADRLNLRGATSIADALNEVPAFRPSNSPASGELAPTAGYIGGRILDLRGLGAVRTLTLLDGKRFVPSTTQATVDINMIPSVLLDRAEVVTGGASAQYGSDAVSGVANLILNHRLTGLRANVQQSITKYGDNGTSLLALAGGLDVTPTLHLVVGGEYEKINGTGDCQARPFCATDVLNFGRNPGVTSRPANNILPNITPSTVPFNGVTVPPNSAYAGRDFPVLRPFDGITFSDNGTPQRFQYGTISNNLYMQGGQGQGQNIYFKDFFLIAPTERYAITGMTDWAVTPAITASVMVNYGHLRSEYSANQYRNAAITVQADNPFIPRSSDPTLDLPTLLAAAHATSFQLGKGFAELGRAPIVTHNETIRAVGGLKADLGHSWHADLNYEFGSNSFRDDIGNDTVTARMLKALDAVRNSSGQIVCRVNADANPANDDPTCVPYNPFGNQASAAAKSYVTAAGYQTNRTQEHDVALNLRGTLFELPAGPVAVAAGGEYRSDSVTGDADALSQALAFFSGNGSRISGQIKVTEGYIEGEVPLLKGSAPFNELSLNGALRRTHYDRSSALFPSSTADATTWKFGGIYEPVSAIRFRVTRSRDIRAPNVAELFGPTTTANGILTDPANSQQTVVTIVSGSNPVLRPEKADTLTVGVVLKPSGGFLGRFRATVDYYDINIKDAISTLGQQNIATRCFQGDALSCAQITRNGSGTITQVNDTLQNVNQLINRGIDFEISYRQPLKGGDSLGIQLQGTYVKDFVTVDAVGPTQRAGQTGLRGGTPAGLPDLQLDGLINYRHGPFELVAHGRYINSGFYNAAFIGPDQAGYSITLSNSSSTNDVPARAYLDLLAQFDVPLGQSSRKATFYIGIDNVTNTTPPLNPGSHGTGNDILFNPAGQTFKTGFRLAF